MALIVFLRLLAAKRPLNYQNLHEKIGTVGSIIIWVVPVVVNTPILITTLPGLYEIKVVGITSITLFHVTHTAPIFATIIIYALLVYTLKQTHGDSEASITMKKSMAKMIQGIVVCLVVLNVPYIVWVQHISVLLFQDRIGEAFTTSSGVNCLC